MTEQSENGGPPTEPNQSTFSPTDNCGVDPPPSQREQQNETGRNLPALAPQHNASEGDEISSENKEPFSVPTGEVSIVFNLDDIEAYAARNAAAAATQCGKALAKFRRGERHAKRLGFSMVALITHNINHDNRQLELFNLAYCLEKSTKKSESPEQTREKLAYRVCEYIYYFFGNATKNNAYIYGHGLDYYIKNNVDPNEVRKLIMELGPEKLYRAALQRNALEKIKATYEQSGRKIDAPIDQSYLLQVASGEDADERTGPHPEPLDEQSQKEQAQRIEMTMDQTKASPPEEDADDDFLSWNDDDQENEDDAEDGDDDGGDVFWDTLTSIQRQLTEVTSIVLRLEKGLNKLTENLQAK